ncbi:MAG TPA: bifunctional 23S rRNA (guanine(2069)-N(7))-methyltransferase RlmK/23S rRNA (guanine(2445)-N(2))-methyltransferase RlmL [Myxococcales bacterium]|jgi:23S rRNA (guanine2445-N2)-methyltransferase / 23S rRNA (guanine2069-N7)-methyltransferase
MAPETSDGQAQKPAENPPEQQAQKPAAPPFFAKTPRGMEPLLAQELRALGAREVTEARAGVAFSGTLETALSACLWSRTASRILLHLAQFAAPSPEALYEGVKAIDWAEHLGPEGTLAVEFDSSDSAITHTHYGALKVKDAIVDQLRTPTGVRPNIDLSKPDVRVNVHLRKDEATVSLDLSGESLHRRGWRDETVPAPLKEGLADAILMLAGWPAAAAEGRPFVDPMCGSGTLPIEAAWIAADVAPGLLREHWGFSKWRGHQPALWDRLLFQAKERDRRGKAKLPPIVGYDLDARAVRAALSNVERAGVHGHVHIEKRELSDCVPVGEKPGLFVVNPPYGERLSEDASVEPLYGRIGDTLKQKFTGWDGYVFTGNLVAAKKVGLKPERKHVLFNGTIECRLVHFPISLEKPKPPPPPEPGSGAEAFTNRLKKDFKHLSKWAEREGVTCWRVYDADLPEYNLAVDLYEKWVHVQEYERPEEIDERVAAKRVREAMTAIPQVLGVRPGDVFLKVRRRQRRAGQYEKMDETGERHEVQEGGLRFLVNFTDYLDTGLFLDHRLVRKLVGELAQGRRFLNLYAYTGTATVYAARGGALSTTTVDLSNTYLDWAGRNLMLNGITGRKHERVRADAMEFVRHDKQVYDLVFCDPPTFSRSKAMTGTFDVQRDHVALLEGIRGRLAPGGVIVFSTNLRRFKLDEEALKGLGLVATDLTKQTLPPDFAGNPRIHTVFRIVRAGQP